MTRIWSVPEPSETLAVHLADGAKAQVRRHGNPEGPRVVLSHGCGLAADMYLPYWSLLTDRVDLLIFDFRSHGWSSEGALASLNFSTFVEDYEAILRSIGQRFGERPAVGIFHSMSALTALLYQQKWGGFAGLVLFDPPVQPPGGSPEDMVYIAEHMSRVMRRRRDRFESHDDYIAYMDANPAYRRLRPGVSALMAETLLRPDGEGYTLLCPKDHEAQIYEYFYGWSMQVDTKQVKCPIKVVGSDPTSSFTFMPSIDFDDMVRMNYDFLPDATHMLQLEEPERCVELTLQFLDEIELL